MYVHVSKKRYFYVCNFYMLYVKEFQAAPIQAKESSDCPPFLTHRPPSIINDWSLSASRLGHEARPEKSSVHNLWYGLPEDAHELAIVKYYICAFVALHTGHIHTRFICSY